VTAIVAGQDRRSGSGSEPAVPPRVALAALALAMLLSSLGTSIANVALPALAEAFGASFQQVQWIMLSYLLAVTTLVVSAGRLGDLVGRRRLLLAGIALFTLASALCGIAPTLTLLIAARSAQGLGAAVMMALAMAFVGDTVPKERTGSAMGLLGTMSAAGTALGPSLGGLLLAGPGWRAIFLINVPLGLLAGFLAWHHLPLDREGRTAGARAFDLRGTLLLALTLGAYSLAMTSGGGSFGALNLALLASAAVGVILFRRAQAGAGSPLIPLAMLSDPALSASLAMGALVSTVVMATLVVGPFYLAGTLGLEAAAAGLALSVGPLAAALTTAPAGAIADRFGARRGTMLGLAAMAAGSLALAAMPEAFGLSGYLAAVVAITIGYALFQTANNKAAMTAVGPDRRGVASGLVQLSRNLGLVTGASVMGAVFAFGSGASAAAGAAPELVAQGMRSTFAVATFLVAIALAIATVAGARAARQALPPEAA